ncbi:OmpA family protein [bacterium]|nr:OmpA family protein [bacterium]
MNRSEVKITAWGTSLFFLFCFFCLKTHLYHIPQKLQTRCIELIESVGGTCRKISLNGRYAKIAGTVADKKIADSLKTALSQIPGIRLIAADFQLHEDSVKVLQIQWFSNQHIYFKKNSVDLPPSAICILDSLATFLKQHTKIHLTIRGNTDSQGSNLFNQVLSEKRAYTVRKALIRSDCDSTQLHALGLGEQLADSLSLEDSLIRRVDFYFKKDTL